MERFTRILFALFLLISIVEGIIIHHLSQTSPPKMEVITVHDTVIDTLRYRCPVPYDSAVVRYYRVPIYKRVEEAPDSATSDTLPSDSLTLPITQKVYHDSTFTAYVSGFQPQLDSFFVYPRTIYVNRTEKVKSPPYKGFGWGPQLGVGITPKGLLPYAGFGIHYTF